MKSNPSTLTRNYGIRINISSSYFNHFWKIVYLDIFFYSFNGNKLIVINFYRTCKNSCTHWRKKASSSVKLCPPHLLHLRCQSIVGWRMSEILFWDTGPTDAKRKMFIVYREKPFSISIWKLDFAVVNLVFDAWQSNMRCLW